MLFRLRYASKQKMHTQNYTYWYFDTLKGSIHEIGLTKTDILKSAIEECKVSDMDRVCISLGYGLGGFDGDPMS